MAVPFHKLPGASALSGIVIAQGASAAISRKVNLAASGPPSVLNDSSAGYGVGSRWMDITNGIEYVCFDASIGAAVWVSLGIASLITKQTITYSNSFTPGTPILRGASSYDPAQANNQANADMLGVVESSTGTAFTVVYAGRLSWPAHGFTIGSLLFLSPTVAGTLTATEPSAAGQVSKLVAVVLDADSIVVNPTRGVFILPGVAQATESNLGVAKIASQMIVDGGSDDTSIVTSLKLASTPRLPSQNENDALLGTSGVASNTNRFVTNSDTRLVVPWTTAHGRGLASGRPAAATANAGYIYFSTDTLALDRSDGGAGTWSSIIPDSPYARVEEQQNSGTSAGTFTSGSFTKRVFTTKVDTTGFVTLSSGVMTLPSGTYYVRASAPGCQVDRHQIRLQRTSGTVTTLLLGTSEIAPNATANIQTRSHLSGYFTIASSSTIELQHECATTKATNGLGNDAGFGTNVYATIEIWKKA